MATKGSWKVGVFAFQGPDAPQEKDLYSCVHCGLCLNACPTYVETGLETESPRGRIALMKAVFEGRIGLVQGVVDHWDTCLQCRACEAVCPSGVPYGRLMEQTQLQVKQQQPGSIVGRVVSWVAYKQLLPHLSRLRLFVRVLQLYQRSGIRRLVHASRILQLLPFIGRAEASLPELSRPFFNAEGQVYPAQGTVKHRVAFLSGCVMPLVQGSTMEATVRVLTRNGCEVIVPADQGCCGALNTHGGEQDAARDMARRNIDTFLDSGVDAIVTSSAGCGASMKEYGHLLRDDAVYSEKADQFSRMVQDITEFLASLPVEPPKTPLKVQVTYQDSCHLAHAQRLTAPPRTVLGVIPGLTLVEMEHPDRCCGAGGAYQLTQREMSGQLRTHKLEDAVATGAEIIATANPGCMMQLELGARESGANITVCHVVDLWDQAYRREDA